MLHLLRHKKLAALIGVAFLLRCLIPLGFMPDVAALKQGVVQLALCSATALTPAPAAPAPAAPDHAPDKAQHVGEMCGFAALSLAFAPVWGGGLFHPASGSVLLVLIAVSLGIRRAFFVNPAVSPRGPPAF
jgi:hypothetical protein